MQQALILFNVKYYKNSEIPILVKFNLKPIPKSFRFARNFQKNREAYR